MWTLSRQSAEFLERRTLLLTNCATDRWTRRLHARALLISPQMTSSACCTLLSLGHLPLPRESRRHVLPLPPLLLHLHHQPRHRPPLRLHLVPHHHHHPLLLSAKAHPLLALSPFLPAPLVLPPSLPLSQMRSFCRRVVPRSSLLADAATVGRLARLLALRTVFARASSGVVTAPRAFPAVVCHARVTHALSDQSATRPMLCRQSCLFPAIVTSHLLHRRPHFLQVPPLRPRPRRPSLLPRPHCSFLTPTRWNSCTPSHRKPDKTPPTSE